MNSENSSSEMDSIMMYPSYTLQVDAQIAKFSLKYKVIDFDNQYDVHQMDGAVKKEKIFCKQYADMKIQYKACTHALSNQHKHMFKNFHRDILNYLQKNKSRLNHIAKYYKIIDDEDANNLNRFKYFMQYGDCVLEANEFYVSVQSKQDCQQIRNIYYQMCEGAVQLYQLGILHVDLKLPNIIQVKGVFKIIDFDYSWIFKQISQDSTIQILLLFSEYYQEKSKPKSYLEESQLISKINGKFNKEFRSKIKKIGKNYKKINIMSEHDEKKLQIQLKIFAQEYYIDQLKQISISLNNKFYLFDPSQQKLDQFLFQKLLKKQKNNTEDSLIQLSKMHQLFPSYQQSRFHQYLQKETQTFNLAENLQDYQVQKFSEKLPSTIISKENLINNLIPNTNKEKTVEYLKQQQIASNKIVANKKTKSSKMNKINNPIRQNKQKNEQHLDKRKSKKQKDLSNQVSSHKVHQIIERLSQRQKNQQKEKISQSQSTFFQIQYNISLTRDESQNIQNLNKIKDICLRANHNKQKKYLCISSDCLRCDKIELHCLTCIENSHKNHQYFDLQEKQTNQNKLKQILKAKHLNYEVPFESFQQKTIKSLILNSSSILQKVQKIFYEINQQLSGFSQAITNSMNPSFLDEMIEKFTKIQQPTNENLFLHEKYANILNCSLKLKPNLYTIDDLKKIEAYLKDVILQKFKQFEEFQHKMRDMKADINSIFNDSYLLQNAEKHLRQKYKQIRNITIETHSINQPCKIQEIPEYAISYVENIYIDRKLNSYDEFVEFRERKNIIGKNQIEQSKKMAMDINEIELNYALMIDNIVSLDDEEQTHKRKQLLDQKTRSIQQVKFHYSNDHFNQNNQSKYRYRALLKKYKVLPLTTIIQSFYNLKDIQIYYPRKTYTFQAFNSPSHDHFELELPIEFLKNLLSNNQLQSIEIIGAFFNLKQAQIQQLIAQIQSRTNPRKLTCSFEMQYFITSIEAKTKLYSLRKFAEVCNLRNIRIKFQLHQQTFNQPDNFFSGEQLRQCLMLIPDCKISFQITMLSNIFKNEFSALILKEDPLRKLHELRFQSVKFDIESSQILGQLLTNNRNLKNLIFNKCKELDEDLIFSSLNPQASMIKIIKSFLNGGFKGTNIFNKSHLKTLHLQNLTFLRGPKNQKLFHGDLQQLRSIEHLYFDNCSWVNPALIETLSLDQLFQLKELSIEKCNNFGDRLQEDLKAMINLTYLSISYTKFNVNIISRIQFVGLKYLVLNETSVTSKQLNQILKKHDCLRELSVKGCKQLKLNELHLKNMKSLEKIYVNKTTNEVDIKIIFQNAGILVNYEE